MSPLPPPRTPGRYRVAVVCLGNICRSPIADVVLRDRLASAALDDRVEVVSAGTGDWHIGNPMDRRAAATLRAEGYDGSTHRAQQIPAAWLAEQDLLLAMDAQNLRDIGRLGPVDDLVAEGRLRLFRDVDPAGPGDVPDPYSGDDDGFREVLAMVERTCDALVEALAEALEPA